MSNQTPDFDTNTVQYVEAPVVEAWQRAEQVATDSRYMREHKQKQIGEALIAALSEMDSRATAELQTLTESTAKLEKTARVRFSPKPEDAAALLYTRDALKETIKGRSPQEVKALWGVAIEDGDSITARVFAEFLPSIWTVNVNGKELDIATASDWYHDLRAKTEDMQLTDDQRAARAKLLQNAETRKQIERARNIARTRFNGWRLDGDRLSDGLQANIRASVNL